MSFLKNKSWSPYVAGIIIGLLQIPAFIFIATALGVSSAYVTVAVLIAQIVDPSILAIDYAAKHVNGAKNYWQLALAIGIAVGAFLSMRLSGAQRQSISPIWQKVTSGISRPLRFLMAFIGGFILLFGARVADGCTSGHGISGTGQLVIGSFVVVLCIFIGGILTALLYQKK